jgi:hypothetical protein
MSSSVRSLFSRFALLLLLAGLIGGFSPALARPLPTSAAPAAPVAEDTTEYLWVAGSAFHPRDGTSAYETSNGCIYAASSGEFTTHIAVPNGAILHTLNAYIIDNSTAVTSVLTLYDTDAQNYPRDIVKEPIVSSGGFTTFTAPISNPVDSGVIYQVNEAERALALDWEPKLYTSAMQLCGIRISYTPAEVAPDPSYEFIAGAAFVAPDSATAYGYNGGGCTSLKNAGRFLVSDVQIPAGAQIYSIQSYYRDITDTADLKLSLIEYTGLGVSRTLAIATEPMSNTSYKSVSANLTVDPYFSTPLTRSLVLRADFGGVRHGDLRFCGARVEFTPPTTRPAAQASFIAGTTFVPRKWSTDYVSDAAGCISTNDQTDLGAFTAAVQVPTGAEITQIKYFYKSTFSGPTNVALYRVSANGTKGAALAQASNSTVGTGSAVASLKYKVDNALGGLILEWNPGSPNAGRWFCGAQVTYGFVERIYMPLIIK